MRVGIYALGVCLLCAAAANGALVGFTQDFNDGFGGFAGGSVFYTLDPGGVGGPDDQFLTVANDSPGQLGARTLASELNGDLLADGVTGFSLWLKDVGADDELEIHVGVGTAFVNFWQYDVPFIPTETEWTEFFVDLTDTANWTQIIGSGTFEDALANSDRFLVRHDVAPYEQFPDFIAADVGIDRITVVPEPQALALLALGGLAALRRR